MRKAALPGVIVAAVALAVGVAVASASTAPVTPGVEAYDACTRSDERCITANEHGFWLWDGTIYSHLYQACTAEDGPAPCVWDSATQGDKHAGPGIARYVMVR